jgi:hypothetical protein
MLRSRENSGMKRTQDQGAGMEIILTMVRNMLSILLSKVARGGSPPHESHRTRVCGLDRAVLQRFVQEAQDGERSTLLRSSRRHLWSMSAEGIEVASESLSRRLELCWGDGTDVFRDVKASASVS